MLYDETFDYLWNQLANPLDLQATRRLKDYQDKRLKRALLAAALKSYFLEASWQQTAGTIGETKVASTEPVTQPLLVLDGAIRTTDQAASLTADNNNFEIQILRSGGDSRVQISRLFIKDEHQLTPAQCAIRNIAASLGQGAPWPETWPVPIYLAPNETLQLTAKSLSAVPAEETTFVNFRSVAVNGRDQDEKLAADLRDWVKANDLQRPVFLSMVTEGFRSIVYPDATAVARTTAKTMETDAPLLVIGYSALFNRDRVGAGNVAVPYGTANAKWRLQSGDNWSFSKKELDINTFAYAGPPFFWQQMPFPFLLPKGSSLSASFSRLNAPQGAAGLQTTENQDNYVIFRCVTV